MSYPTTGSDAVLQPPLPDVQILTTGKRRIPAHSAVLASASPVLESMLMDVPEKKKKKKRGGKERVIPILGVPYDAVNAFLRLLYSPPRSLLPAEEGKEAEAEMAEHGVHLLVLSHVYRVGWLKRACERALASRMAAEVVVDLLVLARRCDAAWLHLRCMKFIAKDFAAVERTEAWRFLQENDPFLELDILQSLQDEHLRQKRRRRKAKEQRLYAELSEAMECLQHICTEGCVEVAVPPSGRDDAPRGHPDCPNPATCRGLQQLIRHLAACDRKKQQQQRGCPRCKRLWQLLRLHAAICHQPDPCKVPLCPQFKEKMEQMKGKEEIDEEKWKVLAKKVASARVMSYLAKRKRQEGIQEEQPWLKHKFMD
ncbi:BTB/POZ and TAZ domain-containing protein 1-like [Canna indica]|uniref:BTB/POZ and TAZ domain-containing protein 1-like n=1 Tax=Canna indica TaxID=4628 RepID=A0AAQ3KVK3_9LILI|nr:BTB/POZ and TAZ domain-containing protein 1-like [Canna indica]